VVAAQLTGIVDNDVLQTAAGGKADLTFDMLGRAASTDTTLAAIRSLRTGGPLILMGSATVPLQIGFGEMLANDWEILGQFMYAKQAPAELLRLTASGQLDLSPVRIKAFPLAELRSALDAAGARALQQQWPDGVFAEYAHWPAACATPLRGLDHLDAQRLTALAKMVVPYGGLVRGRLAPGETIIVNGATGFYGAGAVLVARALAAGRVVAAGRDANVLAAVVENRGLGLTVVVDAAGGAAPI
jgi:threonine dehydrogenase-like Zn-dependent dehydrogenase